MTTCACRQAALHPARAACPGGVQSGGVVSDWAAGKVARELGLVLLLTSPAWLVMLFAKTNR